MHDLGVITDTVQLDAEIKTVEQSDWCALDTEFMREKTYFPQLCLIQIATSERIFCVDPLAIENLGPMARLLTNVTVEKVLHSATQDIEVLLLATGVVPQPIFDSQVAASLLGFGEQMSYAQLVARTLELEIDKSQSRTDWSQRPMSLEQLRYAKDDVRHLAALYPTLRSELTRLGRLRWLEEELQPSLDPKQYRISPEDAWQRVSGHRRLRPPELIILQELAAWREIEASQRNRPRKWVVGDDILLRLAQHPPGTLEALQTVTRWDDRLLLRLGDIILEIVRKAREIPCDRWPESTPRQKLSAEQEKQLTQTIETLNAFAKSENICPERLASRRDVASWLFPSAPPLKSGSSLGHERPSRLSYGWRAELIHDLARTPPNET